MNKKQAIIIILLLIIMLTLLFGSLIKKTSNIQTSPLSDGWIHEYKTDINNDCSEKFWGSCEKEKIKCINHYKITNPKGMVTLDADFNGLCYTRKGFIFNDCTCV